MKKRNVGHNIFALIFALIALGLTVYIEGVYNPLGLLEIFKTWFGFAGLQLLAYAPIGIGLLLFLILFILIFTRHRPRKLWTGFNVLFVSAAVSLITAKIIKGEIMLLDASFMPIWSAFTNLETYLQIASVLAAIIAALLVFIAAIRSMRAHDYKPKYDHIKINERKAEIEEKKLALKEKPQPIVEEVKVESKPEPKVEVKPEVKPEPIPEPKVETHTEVKPEPSVVITPPPVQEKKVEEVKVVAVKEEVIEPKPTPKEEVKEVVIRRIIEERVIVPTEEAKTVNKEEIKKPEVKKEEAEESKPLYNFQKRRETPKPPKKDRPKPPPAEEVLKKVRKKEAIPGKPLEKASKKDEIKTVQQKPTPKVEPETKPVVKVDKKNELNLVAKTEEENTEDSGATRGPNSEGVRVYHLSKRSEDNKWTIRFAGGKRVIKLCDTQKEAIDYVEALCANNGGTYLVHASRGANKGRIRKT